MGRDDEGPGLGRRRPVRRRASRRSPDSLSIITTFGCRSGPSDRRPCHPRHKLVLADQLDYPVPAFDALTRLRRRGLLALHPSVCGMLLRFAGHTPMAVILSIWVLVVWGTAGMNQFEVSDHVQPPLPSHPHVIEPVFDEPDAGSSVAATLRVIVSPGLSASCSESASSARPSPVHRCRPLYQQLVLYRL